jgi:outer membrane protein TolC
LKRQKAPGGKSPVHLNVWGFCFVWGALSVAVAPRTAFAEPASDRVAENVTGVDAELAREARLETIVRIALAKNPELQEAGARIRVARDTVQSTSHLPEPELKYELMAAPLARPYALDRADAHLFGIRQEFPSIGSLGARSRSGEEQARSLAEMKRVREQELVLRVRQAYAEYYRAEREYELHVEHADLARQVVELARANYQAGRGAQQDVLRTEVEQSRTHMEVINITRQLRAAKSLLNTLMARMPSAPLGPPAVLSADHMEIPNPVLDRLSSVARPEVSAAEHALQSSQEELAGAKSTARWPRFMVGVDYWYMPMRSDPHGYGAMVSMSLPWLNSAYRDGVRAAEGMVAAERSALSAARNQARFELFDAVSGYRAAHQAFTLLEQDLLPQAQRSFETARASYRGGQGDSLGVLDALRSYLEVRVDHERALTRLEMAYAEVDRAAGMQLSNPGRKASGD